MALNTAYPMGAADSVRRWWNQDPLYVREAKSAWERGDVIFVHRVKSDWSTSSWPSAQRLMNAELNRIAAVGWSLQGQGSRESGHGTVLFTFVRG